MKKVTLIGEILVEIMADTRGNGFLSPQSLTGPYPSGAPAIFADQMARLGQPVSIISAVGDDDFGHLNLNRLNADGVDISAVHIDTERPTGSAFVRYREDGSRDFVFNIQHSACGYPHNDASVDSVLDAADHLHVMGSSLSSPAFVELNIDAVERVHSRGGTISFDPNVRKELLSSTALADAIRHILSRTHLFLPSGDELNMFTDAENTTAAIEHLLHQGIHTIVHKRGIAGATLHDQSGSIEVPAYAVDEIDPTGAGDCFGATFTCLWLRGTDRLQALRLAAASGALAVTRRGPMEGTATLDTLHSMINDANEHGAQAQSKKIDTYDT